MPQLKMTKTAAGPGGNYIAGRCYQVNQEVFDAFCGGEDPAAIDFAEAAEIAAASRGEKPERDWKPALQPKEIEPPEPKARAKNRAKR